MHQAQRSLFAYGPLESLKKQKKINIKDTVGPFLAILKKNLFYHIFI